MPSDSSLSVSPADVLRQAADLANEIFRTLGGDNSALQSDLQNKLDDLKANVEKATAELEKPVDLFVHLDGGLIEDICRIDDRPVRVFIHDHDLDGVDPSDLDPVEWSEGKAEDAYHSLYDGPDIVEADSHYVQSIYRAHKL